MGVELVKACSKNLEEFALISANFVRNLGGVGGRHSEILSELSGPVAGTPPRPPHTESKNNQLVLV